MLQVLERAEARVDNVVEELIKMYQWRKKSLWGLFALCVVLCLTQISQYIDYYIYDPVADALESGISQTDVAHAISLGICSGLCAPGVRLLSMLLIAELIHSIGGMEITVSMLAISAAINTMLTIPNLFIWKIVYFNIGSRILIGGKYARPFLAGIFPWVISLPFLYILTFKITKIFLW